MAVGDAYVFHGFLTPVLTLLFFQSHRLLFSHASAEVRGENTPERKVASTWDRTHNHQVMSPTRSPLSHPGGSNIICSKFQIDILNGSIDIYKLSKFLLHADDDLASTIPRLFLRKQSSKKQNVDYGQIVGGIATILCLFQRSRTSKRCLTH